MFEKKIVIGVTFFVTMLFLVPTIFASENLADNIELNTPEYKEHTKGIVVFSHKKHATDYGVECGECHHDNSNKPIVIKEGDPVDRCVVCHTETGKKSKEEKISKQENIKKYHKAALHANCKGCHKQFNKENNLNKGDEGSAPENCKECHPKKISN